MNVNELRKAITDRESNKEFVEEDLREIDERLDTFRGYFNAVYNHVLGSESARFRFNAGLIDADELRDQISDLDSRRRERHDLAIDACTILNRMCDMHELDHICPDVEKDFSGKVLNREEIADFVGQFVYNVYQRGIDGPSLEEIRQGKTSFDTAFSIAEADHRDPNEAYKTDDNLIDVGEFDYEDDGFDPADE